MVIKASASLIFLSINIATFLSLIHSQNNISDYNRCSPFSCANINFTFPFSRSETHVSGSTLCGLPGYQIYCDDPSSRPGILLAGRIYRVKDLYLIDNLMTLVDTTLIRDLRADSCASLRNLTISDAYAPNLPPGTTNLTLFDCPRDLEIADAVRSFETCEDGNVLLVSNSSYANDVPRFGTPSGCNMVMVPVSRAIYLNMSNATSGMNLTDVLNEGFPLTWPVSTECESCLAASGRCGFDGILNRTVCQYEKGKMARSKNWGLIIGVATGISCFALIIVLLVTWRKGILCTSIAKNQSTGDGVNAKEFVKTYQSYLLSNYSYNDIKKIADGFKEKLGEGGYGSVYKGRLSDGRPVAVKLLDKSSNIGHDFVNEVATIGRIHHVNVINLLGFCWNGSKQALVYEYMPNRSLANLLSDEQLIQSLGLSKLLEITIETAHAIEYLHNGCESTILHLDIKPQNVLLDQNFHAKLSDFGLAKVYSRSRSAVTMTAARGTIGYIAPEVFMRNLGNPSHKSDVYSFGMLLLEMAGGRRHIEQNTSSSSEEYFPSWIYEKLTEENDSKTVDSVMEEDTLISKKMVMVGLWCIQINPKDRPSMTTVLEMLSGNVDAMAMPPKPFFFSSNSMLDKTDITYNESDTSALTQGSDSGGM